jgi:hypothetical protein
LGSIEVEADDRKKSSHEVERREGIGVEVQVRLRMALGQVI